VESGDGVYYDVFDPEGKFMVKIPLKTRPYLMRNEKLYTLEQDEQGFISINRYHMTLNY
jgi:hypothetical protein